MSAKRDITQGSAMKFVVLLGFVSLFADVTYEGARSITGPWMAILGASAAAVGVVSGLGELLGYALRIFSGYLSDRTGRYWLLTIIGYFVNLLAVPLLALAGRWEIAAVLIVTERVGKAIRAPSRDAMLSHATSAMGRGWGFGIHEAMDQIGALTGPLVVAAVLLVRGEAGYPLSFAVLAVPAVLALGTLMAARYLYPNPRDLEVKRITLERKGLSRVYWLYLAAVACVAAGYADFPLIAYHLQRTDVAPAAAIPVFYAVAMGVDAIAALIFGRLFDRHGIPVLAGGVLVSLFFAPLAFSQSFGLAVVGMVLWGVGMGAQESVLQGGHRRSGGLRPPRLGLWHLQHRLRGGLVPGQRRHGRAVRPGPGLSGDLFHRDAGRGRAAALLGAARAATRAAAGRGVRGTPCA